MLYAQPLLDNLLVNNFPRRQTLGKQSVARLSNNRGNCVFHVRGYVTTVDSDHVPHVFCRTDRRANRLAGYRSRDTCLLQVHVRSAAI
jgi:hypothetical protein